MRRSDKRLHLGDGPALLRLYLVAPLILFALASSSSQAQDLVDTEFYVHALGNRCLDFGGEASWAIGHPVFIYPCNRTVAQRVRVKEIDDGSHDVELRVRDAYCLGISGPDRLTTGSSLELQTCDASAGQRFALDGDAILMGSQRSGRVTREFVVEPAHNFTPSRTPLVVGTQEVVDAEYFRFRAVDGSDARPHSGFVLVSSEADLDRELTSGGWGKVIEIDDRQPIRLSGDLAKSIPAGVTLRGYRKHTYQGPELFRCTNSTEPAFIITEEDVRLTGFRLSGPDRIRCPSYIEPADDVWVNAMQVKAHTINVPWERPTRDGRTYVVYIEVTTVPQVLIDHLDIGYWHGSGIEAFGPDPGPEPGPCDPRDHRCNPDDDHLTDCPNPPLGYPRETRVRAIGNFLHHLNPYGVATYSGAFILADGNVSYAVRNHSIASSGQKTTGYLAYGNLMLSSSGSHDIDCSREPPPPPLV